MRATRRLPLTCILLACIFTVWPVTVAAEPAQVKVTLDRAVAERGGGAPVSGRLYLFLSQRENPEPRFGPNWFAPEPFFGINVSGVAPGDRRVIDDAADGFPEPLAKLPAGRYWAQALLDHDFFTHHPARGVGNFYSGVAAWEFDPAAPAPLVLALDRVVEEQPFPESEWIKEVVVESELLSAFHHRQVRERAAVILPAGYGAQPERRFPALYIIPGFGGSHRDALRYAAQPPAAEEGEVEFIRVMLSGDCQWGHHVYADSATNGPRGAALVREMIPHIDEHFRTVSAPTARFVTGHSSGGWSSLWLQVTYPDTFGGVWSTSPDPVDFRDYQQVNLYADPPLSLYYDEQGQRRPIGRRGAMPVLWYDSFGKMDEVLGRGGQLRSFEAVFSPQDDDGLPKKLWHRTTGRIDPAVAKAWEQYDIRLQLERNWQALEPKLRGKLHVTTGGLDTFYLEGAVKQLAATLTQLGSDAEISVIPGKDHGNLLTPELLRKMRRQMSEAFLRHHPER